MHGNWKEQTYDNIKIMCAYMLWSKDRKTVNITTWDLPLPTMAFNLFYTHSLLSNSGFLLLEFADDHIKKHEKATNGMHLVE